MIFHFLISTVVPILLKKSLTFLLGGQIGTGPFPKDIGGKGIALIIFSFDLYSSFLIQSNLIVEMKLIIVCFELNFKSFIILVSYSLVLLAKKIQSDLSITS